jgi:branched-chain amino acid transport system permease protein
LLGGCILGIAEAFGAVYFGSTYVNVISFGLLVLILVVRPAHSLRAA